MPTTLIPTTAGPLETLICEPELARRPLPGIVVVHDVWGFTVDVRKISKRVSDAGYITATPNLYSRTSGPRCVVRVLRDLLSQRGRAFDDLHATRTHLASRQDCTGKIGIVGFCMGGGFALLVSADGFSASAPFYPVPLPSGLGRTLAPACPVVASLGARDPWGRRAGPELEQALRTNDIEFDLEVYPNAGHAFANHLPAQSIQRVLGFGYVEAAAEDAWRRVFTFFERHLQ